MTTGKKILLAAALSGAGVILLGMSLFYFIYVLMTETVMKKPSPDRQHSAKLVRSDGFDVIFAVYVDGKRVYSSPDFAPEPVDFREQVIWDQSGKIVLLQVAGKNLFAYDVIQQRELTRSEIRNLKFTPFEELGYEGLPPD